VIELANGLGLTVWALVAARLLGMFGAHALFARAVGLSWWGVAGGLVVALAGLVAVSPPVATAASGVPALSGPGWWAALLLEAGVGVALGTWVGLAAGAVEAAARLVAPGLTFAAPSSLADGPDAGLGTLLAAASIVGAFGLGLHHVLLVAVAETFVDWPLLDPLAWVESAEVGIGASLGRRMHAVTVLALGLSAPWWLTRVVVSVAGGLITGAVPAFEAARRGVEPTLVASLGLLALFASVSAFPWAWGQSLGL